MTARLATRPVRLQLSRKSGFNLQELSRATNGLEAVNVARPSKWGNPFVANDWRAAFRAVALVGRGDRAGMHAAAVELFRLWLTAKTRRVRKDRREFFEKEIMTVSADRERPSRAEISGALHGKNLACWCRPGEPCHADVLLELANGESG